MKERPQKKPNKLGISQKAIDASIYPPDPFADISPSIIQGGFERAEKEQKELFKYTQKSIQWLREKNRLAYGLGFAWAYEMLPEYHTQKPLTSNEIGAMDHTLRESIVLVYKDEKQELVIIGASFTDRIKEDSPAFRDRLLECIKTIEGMEIRRHFLRGVIHALMPFYMREEAKEMEQKLFRINENQNSNERSI